MSLMATSFAQNMKVQHQLQLNRELNLSLVHSGAQLQHQQILLSHLMKLHAGKFDEISASLRSIDISVNQVEDVLEQYGAPYTPGRFPEWK